MRRGSRGPLVTYVKKDENFEPRSVLFLVTPVSFPELRPGLRCLPYCRISIHTFASFRGLRAHHLIRLNAVKFCGHIFRT